MEAREPSPRALAKRNQILGAARKVFLDRGFAGTTMDAVREEAWVSKPTLYNYYPGKEDLFADVQRRFIDEHFGDWMDWEAGGHRFDDTEELRGVLLELAQRFVVTLTRADHLALMRVVVAETPRFPQLGELLKEAAIERVMALVSALLEGAHARGLSDIEDTQAATRMFIGPLLTYVLQDGLLVGRGEPRVPSPERLRAVVDLYMRAIAAPNSKEEQ